MITPAYSPTATERVLPRMALDFTTGVLDSRVTVTRALNTATAINSSGFIAIVNANLPRFDYDPVTLAPKGLLIEESRTNLFFQSQAFDLSPWTQGTNTVTANALTSPDGTTNADLFTVTSTGTGAFSRQISVVVATTAYTVSTFFKKGTADFANITVFDGADGNRYWFNLSTGAVASTAVVGAGYNSVSARIENYNNGWYRCSVTFTNKSSASFNLFASFTDADASLTATNGKTGYLYGAQLEAGAFATSYIPTTTTSLTRNADAATMTGTNFSSWYNPTEGAFSVNGSTLTSVNTSVPAFLAVSDGTNLNYAAIFADDAAGRPQFVAFVGGANQFDLKNLSFTNTANVPFTAAGSYKVNDFAMSTNGSAVSTDALGTMPTVDRFGIGCRHGNSRFLNGHIKKISYWPQRIINNEVQAFSK